MAGLEDAVQKVINVLPMLRLKYPPLNTYNQAVDLLVDVISSHIESARLERVAVSAASRSFRKTRANASPPSSAEKKSKYSLRTRSSNARRPRRKDSHSDSASAASSEDDQSEAEQVTADPEAALRSTGLRKTRKLRANLSDDLYPGFASDELQSPAQRQKASAALDSAVPLPSEIIQVPDEQAESFSESESSEDELLPVVRPMPYVRDNALSSDRYALTPTITASDDDTDTENQRFLAARRPRTRVEEEGIDEEISTAPHTHLSAPNTNVVGQHLGVYRGVQTKAVSQFVPPARRRLIRDSVVVMPSYDTRMRKPVIIKLPPLQPPRPSPPPPAKQKNPSRVQSHRARNGMTDAQWRQAQLAQLQYRNAQNNMRAQMQYIQEMQQSRQLHQPTRNDGKEQLVQNNRNLAELQRRGNSQKPDPGVAPVVQTNQGGHPMQGWQNGQKLINVHNAPRTVSVPNNAAAMPLLSNTGLPPMLHTMQMPLLTRQVNGTQQPPHVQQMGGIRQLPAGQAAAGPRPIGTLPQQKSASQPVAGMEKMNDLQQMANMQHIAGMQQHMANLQHMASMQQMSIQQMAGMQQMSQFATDKQQQVGNRQQAASSRSIPGQHPSANRQMMQNRPMFGNNATPLNSQVAPNGQAFYDAAHVLRNNWNAQQALGYEEYQLRCRKLQEQQLKMQALERQRLELERRKH